MKAAGDLLVEQNVLHCVGDVRVKADGELADVARAFIGVEDLVELLAVALARGFDDLAVLEDQADVLEALAVVDGGRVVLQHAVDTVAYGRGEALAVGDVLLAAAGNDADVFDGKCQISFAWSLDVHFVGLAHAVREWRAGSVHFRVIDAADLEVEVFELLGRLACQLRH